jgi:membrane protein
MDVRQHVDEIREDFAKHDLLTYAGAISFHVMTAVVPLALFTLALLGFLSLDSVWTNIADNLKPQVSGAVFTVIDDTVRNVLGSKQPAWLTVGLAVAMWRLSVVMRTVMGALNRVYEAPRDQPLQERVATSLALSAAVTVLILLALAVIHLGPLVVPVDGVVLGVLSAIVRWGIAGVLLLVAVGLVIRYAPATPQPLGWVSFGSLVCVAAWVLTSVAFGFYVTSIANYGSLFGSFATLFVVLTYVYLSAIAFLAGVALDAHVREETTGSPDG